MGVCQFVKCPLLVAFVIAWGYIIDKLTPTMNYLNETLLPLIEGITPKQSESYTLDALGLERQSSQSILISFRERIEQFLPDAKVGKIQAKIIADENCVIGGLLLARTVFKYLDNKIVFKSKTKDGNKVKLYSRSNPHYYEDKSGNIDVNDLLATILNKLDLYL